MLNEALAKVEAAEAMTRDLFIEVAQTLIGPFPGGDTTERAALWNALYRFIDVEAWESAALALVERVLPGRDIDLELREGMQDGQVYRFTDATIYAQAYSDDKRDFKAFGNSPALALLSALLRDKAKDAQQAGSPQAPRT